MSCKAKALPVSLYENKSKKVQKNLLTCKRVSLFPQCQTTFTEEQTTKWCLLLVERHYRKEANWSLQEPIQPSANSLCWLRVNQICSLSTQQHEQIASDGVTGRIRLCQTLAGTKWLHICDGSM